MASVHLPRIGPTACRMLEYRTIRRSWPLVAALILATMSASGGLAAGVGPSLHVNLAAAGDGAPLAPRCPGTSTNVSPCGTIPAGDSTVGARWWNTTGVVSDLPATDGRIQAIYDQRDREVLLTDAIAGNLTTWTYADYQFSEIHPLLSPSGVEGSLGYDGADGYPLFLSFTTDPATTWAFINGSWTVRPTAHSPSGWAAQGTLVDDWADGVVLLYAWGTNQTGSGVWEYLWEYANQDWTNLTHAAPPPQVVGTTVGVQYSEAIAYDSTDGYVVLFGGPGAAGGGSTWKFLAGQWTEVCSSCGPFGGGIASGSITDDPADGYLLVFGAGNRTINGWAGGNATWTFASGAWAQAVTPVAPSWRFGAEMTFDGRDAHVLLIGGFSVPDAPGGHPFALSDIWEYGQSIPAAYPITFEVAPAAPGGVGFAGQTYSNGTRIYVPNGTYPLEPVVNRSGGNSSWVHFSGWTVSGGPTLLGDRLIVNGSGGVVLGTFVPYPRVRFLEDGCGPITFNGTPYANGSFGQFLLSEGPFAVSASACTAYQFVGWLSTGGVSLANGSMETVVTVLGNGTLTAAYGRVENGPVITAFLAEPTQFALGGRTQVSVTVAGGVPPYHFAYRGLPVGCPSVDQSVLLCIPTVTGTFQVTLWANDSTGAYARGSMSFEVLPVTALPTVTAFSATPDPVTAGQQVTFLVDVVGGTPPLSYYYSALPPGCRSVAAPALVCAPLQTGTFAVTVTVADAAGHVAYAGVGLAVVSSGGPLLPLPGVLASPAGLLGLGTMVGAATGVSVGWRRRSRATEEPAATASRTGDR